MICPNKSLDDWAALVNKFGEDGAYYIFMKNGGEVPYLQGWESNRFVWDVENKHGLVTWKKENGKNVKKPKSLSESKSIDIAEQLRDDYVGAFGINRTGSDVEGEYTLKVAGHPILRSEVEEYAKELNIDSAKAERDYKEYKDFKELERGSTADIIPPNYYDQNRILYDNPEYRPSNEEEKFNELQISNLKSILTTTMPQVKEIVEDRTLTVKGQLESGVIKVNPDTMTKDTIGHEFGHLLIDLRGGLNNSFIVSGIEQLETSEMAKKVREKYADRSEEVIKKEILATAIGTEVADIFESEEGKTKFERWLNRFFRWMEARLGITKNHARQLADTLLKGKALSETSLPGVISNDVQEQREDNDITEEEGSLLEDTSDSEEVTLANKAIEEELDAYQEVRRKALKITQERIDKSRKFGRQEDRQELYKLIEDLEKEEISDHRVIFQFAVNAAKYINGTYSSYLKMQERYDKGDEGAFDIKTMTRWHDVLSAYNVLDDITGLILKDGFPGTTGQLKTPMVNKLRVSLQDTIAKKNILISQYREQGDRILAEELTRFSGKIKIQKKAQKKLEWDKANRGKKYSASDKIKLRNKYADDYVKRNATAISQQINVALRAEAKKASGDIGLLTRWLDTMLNTSDLLTGAMVKKFVIKDDEARQKALAFKSKAWPLVQAMYKESGYTYASTNVVGVYDYMLEVDRVSKKRTGYLIGEFSSALTEAKNANIQSTEHLPVEERDKKRREWAEENEPLDKAGYRAATNEFVDSLVELNKLTTAEAEAYKLNMQVPFVSRMPLNSLLRDNREAADAISQWRRDNIDDYKNPIEKWKNGDWIKLKAFMEANPESPKTKFYELIVNEGIDIDKGLDPSKKQHKKLPFKFKDTIERETDGQNIKAIAKDSFERLTKRRLDEDERGQYTDSNDRVVDYLPWHYNRPPETSEHIVKYKITPSANKIARAEGEGKLEKLGWHTRTVLADTAEEAKEKTINNVVGIDPDSVEVKFNKSIGWTDADQSYDLMGLYYDFHKMATRYNIMNELLPEVELVTRITEDRKYEVTDKKGNAITKLLGQKTVDSQTKDGVNANLTAMWKDFVKAQAYGQTKEDEGEWDMMGWEVDKAKARDNLGKYASYTMLGLNLVQAISNVTVGELTQSVEAIAGEFITIKDLHKATVRYGSEMPAIMGDVGQNIPTSKLGLLNEKFNTLNEYEGGEYKKNSKFARMMNSSVLFFMSHAGEHFMQTRLMMAMLDNVVAYDKDGNELGSMYEMYNSINGELVLDKRVDLVKSDWNPEDQTLFGAKTKRLLARLHGEYSDIGKNAAQRWSIGRMGMMFRKFIVPGFNRRWEQKKTNEFLNTEVEGSYRTMFNFLIQATKETKALGLASYSENWSELSDVQQANMLRGVGELGAAILIGILAGAFMTLKGESDDDEARAMLAAASYIALRVQSEMLFFINPVETMTILKSPAVATSVIENVIKLIGQLTNITDVYERGSWAGSPKIYKTIANMVPGVKAYYKTKNIEDALAYFNR